MRSRGLSLMFEFMPAVVASENSIRRRNGGNESVIAIGLLFVRICVTASSREGGWKRKSWSCGISSMFYSSARHIV
jgi:hypothetical protein